jgi:hypothetical protein
MVLLLKQARGKTWRDVSCAGIFRPAEASMVPFAARLDEPQAGAKQKTLEPGAEARGFL